MALVETGCGWVLIAEDDDECRELIAGALRSAGFAVREAADGDAAVAAVSDDPPALAVLDIRLPGVSGYEIAHRLRDRLERRVGIVFVSGERTESYDRVGGLLVGADDYMVKPFAPDELVARVRSLARRTQTTPRSPRLTPREQEILQLLADGLDQATIAGRLVLSPSTVATHVDHILAKLGVHSRTQAVALAFRLELVSRA